MGCRDRIGRANPSRAHRPARPMPRGSSFHPRLPVATARLRYGLEALEKEGERLAIAPARRGKLGKRPTAASGVQLSQLSQLSQMRFEFSVARSGLLGIW